MTNIKELVERMNHIYNKSGRVRLFYVLLADAYESGELTAEELEEACAAFIAGHTDMYTHPYAARIMASKIKHRHF